MPKRRVKMSKYAQIDGQVMKSLIDSKVPLVILDARPNAIDDGRRIPGAKILPYNTEMQSYKDIIKDKDTLTVVYCGSTECPAKFYLADNLIAAGYKNVLVFAGGIHEWADERHYPVEEGIKTKIG